MPPSSKQRCSIIAPNESAIETVRENDLTKLEYSAIHLHHTVISYNPNFLSRKPTAQPQPQPQPQPLYPKLVKSKITMYIMNTTYNIIKDKNTQLDPLKFLISLMDFCLLLCPKTSTSPHVSSIFSSNWGIRNDQIEHRSNSH